MLLKSSKHTGNDFFVFHKFPLPSTFLLHPLRYRCSGIPGNQIYLAMFRNVVNIKCHMLENSMKFHFSGRNLRIRRLTLQSTINGSCIGSAYLTYNAV